MKLLNVDIKMEGHQNDVANALKFMKQICYPKMGIETFSSYCFVAAYYNPVEMMKLISSQHPNVLFNYALESFETANFEYEMEDPDLDPVDLLHVGRIINGKEINRFLIDGREIDFTSALENFIISINK